MPAITVIPRNMEILKTTPNDFCKVWPSATSQHISEFAVGLCIVHKWAIEVQAFM